jgi:hypothetical protein
MINKIIEIYEQEMNEILPYKWDWRGSLLAIGTCVLTVLCVVAIMLTIAGL